MEDIKTDSRGTQLFDFDNIDAEYLGGTWLEYLQKEEKRINEEVGVLHPRRKCIAEIVFNENKKQATLFNKEID